MGMENGNGDMMQKYKEIWFSVLIATIFIIIGLMFDNNVIESIIIFLGIMIGCWLV